MILRNYGSQASFNIMPSVTNRFEMSLMTTITDNDRAHIFEIIASNALRARVSKQKHYVSRNIELYSTTAVTSVIQQGKEEGLIGVVYCCTRTRWRLFDLVSTSNMTVQQRFAYPRSICNGFAEHDDTRHLRRPS